MANTHAQSPAPAPADDGDAPRQPGAETAPPFWEWVIAAIGLVLVLASIGYLSWAALTEERGDARPAIELLSVQPQDGRFLVRVRVTNQGRGTAETLRITGTLRRGEEVVEQAELEFQYLPGQSSREGGLFFTHDPRPLRLELAPQGYRVP